MFSTELSNLPLASSSGGFVYRLDPGLGVVSRVSDAFGPFFTERVLRNGKGQWSVGLSFQASEFSSLQGADLESGTFPIQRGTLCRRHTGLQRRYARLELDNRSVTVFASYGITERFVVAGAIPMVRVHFRGQRSRTVSGVTALQSSHDAVAARRSRCAGSSGSPTPEPGRE